MKVVDIYCLIATTCYGFEKAQRAVLLCVFEKRPPGSNFYKYHRKNYAKCRHLGVHDLDIVKRLAVQTDHGLLPVWEDGDGPLAENTIVQFTPE